jgi:hypothetical protein
MEAFSQSILTLYESQLRRLQSSHDDPTIVERVSSALTAAKLTPESIKEACRSELVRIVTKTYEPDEPTHHGSHRLNGFGWSKSHVNDHMDRFLKNLLDRQSDIFRKISLAEK